MVEYGGGIQHGPAGQVSGSGGGAGSHPFGGADSIDLGAAVGGFFNNSATWLQSLSPFELVLLGVAVLIGLMLLRRAF